MNLFLIPQRVQIVFSLDPALLALVKQFVAQASDRKDALELAEEVRATTGALQGSIPSSS